VPNLTAIYLAFHEGHVRQQDRVQTSAIVAQRFVLERLVGVGGVGKVYRAIDREQARYVALKIIAGSDSGQITRFAEEARILATLDHPGIVRWIAHGEADTGQRWLALEWLDGEDLATRLSRGSLEIDDCVALGVAISDALVVAHAHGIIHRDIKPSNIFLPNGDPRRAKLLDFGVARRTSVTRIVTRTGVVVGTIGYIPPEQVRGETIDARADLFGLGSVLFECLAGRPAFATGALMAVLTRLLVEAPPSLHALRQDIPPEFEALIMSMLAKDPNARPPNAHVVLESLQILLRDRSSRQSVPAHAGALFEDSERHFNARDLASSPDDSALPLVLNETEPSETRGPFVGRDRELSTLTALFEQCANDHQAQAVLVTGPPGIGKTRLSLETMAKIRELHGEVEIWAAGCSPKSEKQPYALIKTLLPKTGKDSKEIGADFLVRASEVLATRPLMLVIDHMQWTDVASTLVIDQALKQLRDRSLFVMAMATPDVHARFSKIWPDNNPQEIILGCLAARAATRLIRECLGERAEPSTVKALFERSGGHPFYLQQLASAAATGQTDSIPAPIVATLIARFAKFTADERRFLRAASVFGDVFQVRGVQHLLAGDAPDVAHSLVERNVLMRQSNRHGSDDQTLSFRERLVREVVYLTLTSDDRQKSHALAGEWLKSSSSRVPK